MILSIMKILLILLLPMVAIAPFCTYLFIQYEISLDGSQKRMETVHESIKDAPGWDHSSWKSQRVHFPSKACSCGLLHRRCNVRISSHNPSFRQIFQYFFLIYRKINNRRHNSHAKWGNNDQWSTRTKAFRLICVVNRENYDVFIKM